jgi:hypothetical protein
VSALWPYFWPIIGAGLVVGIVAGAIAFRRPRRRHATRAIGLLVAIGLAALWHGPLGAADHFARAVERSVRQALVFYEIPEVSGHLHHAPLTRTVLLSGPADDFQRSELVRLIGEVPGVASVSWDRSKSGMPLIAEGAAGAVLGFLFGLLLAYLVELRRRYNAQYNW